jgi:hypothetical protein
MPLSLWSKYKLNAHSSNSIYAHRFPSLNSKLWFANLLEHHLFSNTFLFHSLLCFHFPYSYRKISTKLKLIFLSILSVYCSSLFFLYMYTLYCTFTHSVAGYMCLLFLSVCLQFFILFLKYKSITFLYFLCNFLFFT